MKEVMIDGVAYVPKQQPKEEPKKEPEVGKWYTYTAGPERGAGQCKEINSVTARYLIYFPEWSSGHNGMDKYSGRHCWWCYASELVEVPAPLPARGDPIFVWDDIADERCPAVVLYFHHQAPTGKIFCFLTDEFNVSSTIQSWDHYRPFDAALVGVPRKSWPQ